MSFNGSGSFLINTAGQPVVTGTVISSTAFNALTADLATGLSTCITKDGQTTVTANIPMSSFKFTGLGAGSAAADSVNLAQVQSTTAKLLTSVSGTDTITAVGAPALTAYAAGQMFYFVAAGDNTGAVTLNIDALGAKAVTRDGSVALASGDLKSGEVVVVVYDGTRFQVVSQVNSAGDVRFANVSIASTLNVGGVATITGNAGFSANVSIVSALSVGGVATITGGATLGVPLTVASGGTNSGTAAGARSNILNSYTGNSLKVLRVNAGETDTEWATVTGGTVSSIDVSGGTTGLTTSGGPITTSGTITLSGTLNVANGGTGVATLTGIAKGNGTSAFSAATAGTDYAKPDTSSVWTATQTFRAANAIRSEAADTQDAIVIAGRAGGTNSYAATITPTTLSANRTVTIPNETFTVGFRNIPAVGTQTGSYTLAVGDVGKYVQVGSGGSVTIPDATFAEGDIVSIFNNTSGNITITCSITTAYIAGVDSDKASVTLATRGVASVLFISGTVCVISGNVT